MTDARRELEDEALAAEGDPRRCPRHPEVRTSSPDGMFDAPCNECEAAMEAEDDGGPPPGTWAATARGMADLFPDFDWDAWKDEMKEADL